MFFLVFLTIAVSKCFGGELGYFGGGCFWGVQHLFSQVDGVENTWVGYMGGQVENPEYPNVKTGETGHVEVVKLEFNENVVSYKELVKFFFEIHDPTQEDKQGIDHGTQYHSTIFFVGNGQKDVAVETIKELEEKESIQIKTKIVDAEGIIFWIGEDYHQNYFVYHPEEHVCHEHVKKF